MAQIEDTTAWYSMTSAPLGLNVTLAEAFPSKPPALKMAYDLLIPIILSLVMLAMGCGISLGELRDHLRRPLAPALGLVSQFAVMPVLGYSLAHALRLLPHHAVGMMIIASSPGGTMSNIYTYWSRGDLSLSICMTLLSSVLALGFMPLNMFIYVRTWTSQKTSIPFVQIVIIILLNWIPVGLGMVIKHKTEKWARRIIRLGSVAGFLLLIVAGALQSRLYPEFFHLRWNVWLGAWALPAAGYIVGFGLATCAYLRLHMRRTVALETGLQNTALALTLITLSFRGHTGILFSQFPLLYAAAQQVLGLVVTFAHALYFYLQDRAARRREAEKGTGARLLPEEKLQTMEIITCFDAKPQHAQTLSYTEPHHSTQTPATRGKRQL